MAIPVFPDQNLSSFVQSFAEQLEEDFQSPTVSKFQDYVPRCRAGLQAMEENLSVDKSSVHKLTGSMKELFRSGEVYGNSMRTCAEDLIKFGTTMSTTEPILGNNFVKFGTLLTQMSSLLTNLVSSSKNILLFSLNLLFENELRGSKYKADTKALFGQYQSARTAVEREEKKALIAAGINVTDRVFTAEEFASKLVTDRRKFQLGTTEYLLKYNEVKTKRGVDLAEHLLAYNQAQETYFKDNSNLINALKQWQTKFQGQISELKTKQDDERKVLVAAKEKIRSAMGMMGDKLHGPTQVDPSLCTGMTEKSGYLGKKPENTLRLPRRQWPKRYCTVSMQGFTLANSHNHNPQVKIPVIHFQCKDCHEAIDGRKYCFKLIAQTKTYTFDAESEKDLLEWKQAMQNCQLKLFQGETDDTLVRGKSGYGNNLLIQRSDTRQLVKDIVAKIRVLPGNSRCADCGAADPEWLSVNLGILICIHCSGRHREMSVQYSRIRSLKLDQLKTHELLIALFMGNDILNEIMEANLTDIKPLPESTNDFRGEYISNKYLHRKYIEHSIGKEGLLQELADAVDSRDIKQLLQVYAEGVDMCAPLPSYSGGLTALHLAIELEDLTSLHVVDFLLGNGNTENVLDVEMSSPLHLAVVNDSPQCIKLLLNHRANISIKDAAGQTALDIAIERKYDECIELLQDAGKNKFSKCEHIDLDWGVGIEGEEEIYQTPMLDSTLGATPPAASIKKSDTSGNLSDKNDPPLPPTTPRSAMFNGGAGRKRPASTYLLEYSSPRASPLPPLTHPPRSSPVPPQSPRLSPAPPALRQLSTSESALPNTTSGPAPPPPPRTLSKHADPVPNNMVGPVPPARRKKIMSMFPDQLESSAPLFTVTALYDCDPDQPDELGFKEGETIVVTKKLSKDWWKGYVLSGFSRKGIFPKNYVKEQGSVSDATPPSPGT